MDQAGSVVQHGLELGVGVRVGIPPGPRRTLGLGAPNRRGATTLSTVQVPLRQSHLRLRVVHQPERFPRSRHSHSRSLHRSSRSSRHHTTTATGKAEREPALPLALGVMVIPALQHSHTLAD